MKTLINKANPQIRITAPEITLTGFSDGVKIYWIPGVHELCGSFSPDNWSLVEAEPVDKEQTVPLRSKFVFPKFLYARTTNNKTIDVSYVPQSLDAVEYTRSDSLQQEQKEPEKLHIDKPRGYKLASEDATANGFNQPKEPVDFDEIAEKWVTETASGTADEEEFLIDIFKKGLEMGYNLGKGGKII